MTVSYQGEWALFEDYCAATGQLALPTTAATVEAFLAALPAQPSTLHRRVLAIAAAHRRAGYRAGQWSRTKPACKRSQLDDAGAMIATCPTRGWPVGFTGRRDGFLVVLVEVLGHTQRQARRLTPAEITFTDEGLIIDAAAIPASGDPRTCPACATVRWLEVCDLADGLGQAIAAAILTAATVPTATSGHTHTPAHQRWREVAWLVVGIDQYGWLRDAEPLSERTISTRLATARTRAHSSEIPA